MCARTISFSDTGLNAVFFILKLDFSNPYITQRTVFLSRPPAVPKVSAHKNRILSEEIFLLVFINAIYMAIIRYI